MSTLTFQNPGEIDPRSFTTFGLNAKPNSDSPIGFFGTGLKYAIAIVLRLGGKITIHSGRKRYALSAREGEFRGKEIKEVVSNGRTPLPFTTELGKSWEPWMAFRELYCNAKDEGGDVFPYKLDPEPGKTTIVVTDAPALMESYEKRSAFMLDPDNKPIYKNHKIEVRTGRSNGIYFRGILVGQSEHDGLYTYNLLDDVYLTEDRTMKNAFLFPYKVAAFWMSRDEDSKALREVIGQQREPTLEAKLPWDICGVSGGEKFWEVVGDERKTGAGVNDKLRAMHDHMEKGKFNDERIALLPEEQKMLDRAKQLLRETLGYDVSDVEVVPVRTLGHGTFGLSDGRRIFISKRCFEAGQRWVTGTLLEEYGHHALGWCDESRDMQNSLINIIAQLMEKVKDPMFELGPRPPTKPMLTATMPRAPMSASDDFEF